MGALQRALMTSSCGTGEADISKERESKEPTNRTFDEVTGILKNLERKVERCATLMKMAESKEEGLEAEMEKWEMEIEKFEQEANALEKSIDRDTLQMEEKRKKICELRKLSREKNNKLKESRKLSSRRRDMMLLQSQEAIRYVLSVLPKGSPLFLKLSNVIYSRRRDCCCMRF